MVGLFGLLGNMLSISVLSSKDMNNSFYKLLLSLSVFDSVFITFVTLEYSFVRGEAGGKSGRQNKVVISSFFLAHHGHQHGLHIHLPQGKTLAENLALTLSVLRSSTLSTTSACAAVSTPPWPCPMRGGSTVRLTSIATCRFTAVCSPYKYRENQIQNKNKTFYKMIPCILTLGIGINIPRF